MHELAIAESVVSSMLEHSGERQVSVVRLRVGRIAGVVWDALIFCFELVAAGTPLDGASLEILEEDGRALPDLCHRPPAPGPVRRAERPAEKRVTMSGLPDPSQTRVRLLRVAASLLRSPGRWQGALDNGEASRSGGCGPGQPGPASAP